MPRTTARPRPTARQELTCACTACPACSGPLYPDYIFLGCFQWVRCISDFKVLATDDPVALWRGRMLSLYDGLAGKAKGYPV